MYVVSVDVFVIPDKVDAFIEAILANARGTRQEPGNLRFDISQANDDADQFLLYEVYTNEAAFHAHQQTEHYKTWKATVADWMAKPRQGVKYHSLFPQDGAAWS